MLKSCSRYVFQEERLALISDWDRELYIEWILKRNIPATHLMLSRNFESKLKEKDSASCELFPRLGPVVSSVRVAANLKSAPNTMKEIALHCSDLHSLELCQVVELSDEFILTRFAQLRKLVLKETFLGASEYRRLASCAAELRHLEFHMDYGDTEFKPSMILKFLKANPNLEHLNISSKCPADVFQVLAEHCPNLQQLHLLHCIAFIDPTSFALMLANCPRITHLTLHVNVPVPESAGAAIAEHCPHLQSLHCSLLSSTSVQRIVTGCRNLKSIALEYYCNAVVQTVSLTDETLHAIAQRCAQLTDFAVSGRTLVSAAGLHAMAQLCCSQLRSFHFASSTALTDSVLSMLLSNGGAVLTDLSVVACATITDAGLSSIATHCGATLTSLNVQACARATEAGITAIAQHCTKLRNFKFNCPIGDATAAAIAHGCTQLQYLLLESCLQLTDTGLTVIAQGCSHLVVIRIDECVKISDEGVEAVAQHCTRLRDLDLTRLPRITVAALAAITQHCRRLAYLTWITKKFPAEKGTQEWKLLKELEERNVSFTFNVVSR